MHEQAAVILKKPWTDFLSFNLLRHGEESASWQSALKVVDAVVWSVQQKQAVDNKEDFHRRQQEFESTIREGLLAMGYDPEASKGLLNGLREAQELAYHEVVLHDTTPIKTAGNTEQPGKPEAGLEKQGARSKIEASVSKKAPQSAIERQQQSAQHKAKSKLKKLGVKDQEPISPEEQKKLETLKDIAFGTWFDFKTEAGRVDRMKLAWYSRVTSNYMFVNNAGVKQAVMTKIELAKGLTSGQISLVELEKRTFMERALVAVLNKLKPKAAVEAG